MVAELSAHLLLEVVLVCDQDHVIALQDEDWADVDLAIVDVFDEYASGEIGTDIFSGITALERLRSLPLATMAITSLRGHLLIDLRIC